jgi:hypothetical protein
MFKSERNFWIAFGALWGAALLAGIVNTRRGEDLILRQTGRGSFDLYWLFLLAYLIGGVVIAILHSRWVEQLPGSAYTRTETPAGAQFATVPAPKFFAMWPTGAIGIVFVLSLPEILFGSGPGAGFGLLACLGFGGALILMAYVPKLWRRGRPCTFTVSSRDVKTDTLSFDLGSPGEWVIGNALRYKPYKVPPQIGGRMSLDVRRNIYYAPGGNPLAAQALAGVHDAGLDLTNAIGNGLGEMAYRYYVEMRARSWQLKIRIDGKDHLLADGLDGGCAQALFDEVVALTSGRHPTIHCQRPVG